MKKLIYPAIIACIAMAVTSCSKSATDLVALEKKSKKETSMPKQDMNPGFSEVPVEAGSTIFPYINQEVNFTLGDLEHELFPGTTAVLYVSLSGEFANNPASFATLTLRDDNTSEDIQVYDLISSAKADAYGISVPEELAGQAFMFAFVHLDDQYRGRTISLQSEIKVNESISIAGFDKAFLVSFYIIPNL